MPTHSPGLGLVHIMRGDNEQAEKYLTTALRLDSTHTIAQKYLTQVRGDWQDFRAARD